MKPSLVVFFANRRLVWKVTTKLDAAFAPGMKGIGAEAIQSIRSVVEQAVNLTT